MHPVTATLGPLATDRTTMTQPATPSDIAASVLRNEGDALLAYAKNARSDMTPDEKRTVAALATALKAAWKERK